MCLFWWVHWDISLYENPRFSSLISFAALLHGKLPFPDPFSVRVPCYLAKQKHP